MKRDGSEPFTPGRVAELRALSNLPDEDIDTHDIPEQRDWSGAKRGVFFRPVKQQLTLRLDADLIAWFKAQASEGRGYQTRINGVLRAYMTEQSRE